MNTLLNPNEEPARPSYSAKKMAKQVNFYLRAPTAKSVSLVGEFNHWNPLTSPLQRREDGWWFAQVPLTPGHHAYFFLVDGVATLDPRASGTVQMSPDTQASVIAVS